MTISTKSRRNAAKGSAATDRNAAPAPVDAFNIKLTGKTGAARLTAFQSIAPHAYSEGMARNALLDALRMALGSKPTASQVAVAKAEYAIGRTTARLPANEFPDDARDPADRLDYVRDLVMRYAAPAKEGAKSRKLRAGQLGRRTPAQHKAIRASEEAWSLIAGELGIGNARTMAEKNKRQAEKAAKRNPAPHHKGQQVATPSHSELVKAPANEADAVETIATMSATLLAFSNKHAGKVPNGIGSAIVAFKKALDKEVELYRSTRD